MARLRTPLLQIYFNPFGITIFPTPLAQICMSEDPSSPRQRPDKKEQVYRKNHRKYGVYRMMEQPTGYHKLMHTYMARNINTLTNIFSSGSDFEESQTIVHVLEYSDVLPVELYEIETVVSGFGDDSDSTKIGTSEISWENQNSFMQDNIKQAIKQQQNTY